MLKFAVQNLEIAKLDMINFWQFSDLKSTFEYISSYKSKCLCGLAFF